MAKRKQLSRSKRPQKKAATAKRKRTPREKAKENQRSFKHALHAVCWECQGEGADPGWRRRIRECDQTNCSAHHLRPYVKHEHQKRKKASDRKKSEGKT